MSTKMQVQWRRARVLEPSSQAYTQSEISIQLQGYETSITLKQNDRPELLRIIVTSILWT
jgi:hypothetical protein